MADPQHLEWLADGVGEWNARRGEGFISPDFSDADIARFLNDKDIPLELHAADFRKSNFERANLTAIDLSRANFWDANIRAATLDRATLDKADLREADLRAARLVDASLDEALMREADLRGANLGRISADGADLTDARLREADLSHAHFVGAVLPGADLRTAKLWKTALIDARLDNADCRTILYGDAPHTTVPTDLSDTIGLTQTQLDTMRGDRGAILPPGLDHPENWTDPAPEGLGPVEPPRPASPGAVRARLVMDRSAVVLTGASLLEQSLTFRERVRGDNRLAAEHPETRDSLLGFLDALAADLERLIAMVPVETAEVTMEKAEEVAGWLDRFTARLRTHASEYVDPDNVAKAALPLGIMLGCGAIGSMLGGPMGFGAGTVLGGYLTNNLKPGAVADRIREHLDRDVDGES